MIVTHYCDGEVFGNGSRAGRWFRDAHVVIEHGGDITVEINLGIRLRQLETQRVAVVLNNEVIATPWMSSDVSGSNMLVVRGGPSLDAAHQFADLVNGLGAFELKVLREWTVKGSRHSPSLAPGARN